MELSRRRAVDATATELFRWDTGPDAPARASPPWDPVAVVARDPVWPVVGTRLELSGGWVERSVEHAPPGRFVSELERGPAASLRHARRFEDGAVTDHVDFRPRLFGGSGLAERLGRALAFRQLRMALDWSRYAPFRGRPRLKVAITGVTGLLGGELARFLRLGGHEVVPVSRREGVRWDPDRGEIDAAALEGVDAVVHLAGESIARRWTAAHKERVLSSRVRSTELLVRTFARMTRKPSVFLCGSAVGVYGDGGESELPESAPAGTGFLADVGRAWEASARPAADLGIRVVFLRTGLVLSARGGILASLAALTRAGGGGAVGGGQQWQPWIAIDDWVGAVHALLWDAGAEGAVNLVAPGPVRQGELATALARVLHRPAWLPAPAFAVRAVLGGEMARELVLASQRAAPERLIGRGFAFLHADLDAALRFELGGLSDPGAGAGTAGSPPRPSP